MATAVPLKGELLTIHSKILASLQRPECLYFWPVATV